MMLSSTQASQEQKVEIISARKVKSATPAKKLGGSETMEVAHYIMIICGQAKHKGRCQDTRSSAHSAKRYMWAVLLQET